MEEEKYSWTQEFSEVELTLVIPGKIDKSLIKFFSSQSSLKIVYNDEILVDGCLSESINADETYWYIADGNLKFVLSKSKGAWWECVIKGHRKIDVSKVAESKTVSDLSTLDPEERNIVQEMMYNQKMKEQGKGPSENEKEDILRKLAEKNSDFFSGKEVAR